MRPVMLAVGFILIAGAWTRAIAQEAQPATKQTTDKPILVLEAGGHTALVRKVVFSPDGKELYSVAEDKTIRVWDVASGAPLRVLRPPMGIGRDGKLYAAALSPDGSTLAVAGAGVKIAQDPIYLVSLATGRIERVLTGHENGIVSLAFSTDGRRLISGSGDQNARIWNVSTGQTEQVLRGHTQPIFDVAFSPDGRRCVTASDDHTAAIWDVSSGQRQTVLKGHPNKVHSVAWRPDGLALATGSTDQVIRQWSPDGKSYQGFDLQREQKVSSLAFTGDSRRLLYTSMDFERQVVVAAVVDASNGREISRFTRHTNSVMHGALSRDGTMAATADTVGEVLLWKTVDGTLVHRLASKGQIPALTGWSPDGTRIAWRNRGTKVGGSKTSGTNLFHHSFDVASLEFGPAPDERIVRAQHESGSLSLALGTASTDGRTNSVIVRQGDRPISTLSFTNPGERVNCYTFLSGERVAVGTGFYLRQYEARTGKELVEFVGHDGSLGDVSSSPDRRYLLSASDDMTLRIWNPDTPPRMSTSASAGIGVGLNKVESGFEIYVIADGSPAATDGRLKVGDLVTAVDRGTGQFVETSKLTSAVVTAHIRGEAGTTLRLKIKRKGGPEQTLELRRGIIPDAIMPLLSLFFAGQDWIAWTPEGYYAASPGGEKLMGWHVNNGLEQMASFYPASQFRSTLYRPDVIKLLLKTGSVERALEEADRARGRMTQKTEVADVLPPIVRITSPGAAEKKLSGADVEISAVATSRGQHPVTAMRLLIDGRPHEGKAGVRTISSPKVGDATVSWNVSLSPGKHRLQVLADSSASQGSSDELEVTYLGDTSLDAIELPTLYVLAVGISAYEGDLKLDYAAKDAEAIVATFQSKSKPLFRKIEVRTLTDKQATRAEILKGLGWLRKEVTQRDFAVFSFSGHGQKDIDGGLYFLPVDADPDNLSSTAILADQFKLPLTALPGKVIMLLDACHSGGVGTASTGRRKGAGELTEDLVRDLVTDESGVVMMCSSTGRESSLENNEARQGNFTLAIVEGLSGKADYNKDGHVYLNELDTYVTDRVKELTRGQQHPVTAKPSSIRSFPLAKP